MKRRSVSAARWMVAVLALTYSFAGGQGYRVLSGDQLASAVVVVEGPSEIDAAGDLYAEFDADGQLWLTGSYSQDEDPTTWQVHFFPDADAQANVALDALIVADADGYFALATGPLPDAIGPGGGLLTVRSPFAQEASIVIWLGPTGVDAVVQRPVPAPPQPQQPDKNRMRVQLQTGTTNIWS